MSLCIRPCRCPPWWIFSGYLLESPREGPDFTFYRGWRKGGPLPVVAVALAAEQLSSQSLRRLQHGFLLAKELLSNLMASGQSHRPDRIRETHREGSRFLKFICEAEALEAWKLLVRCCVEACDQSTK